jgi:hypothetical protein
MTTSNRADVFLVEHNYAKTRAAAREQSRRAAFSG